MSSDFFKDERGWREVKLKTNTKVKLYTCPRKRLMSFSAKFEKRREVIEVHCYDS